MKKQTGLTLIEILIPLAVIIIALAGGVVVWKKKTSPTPVPTARPIVTPSSTRSQSCQTGNDCPKQLCQPPGQPCPQYSCIRGKCQLVEPPVGNECSKLNEKECLANVNCVAVYGPSCPACMDEVFKKCRDRQPGEIKRAPWGG